VLLSFCHMPLAARDDFDGQVGILFARDKQGKPPQTRR
jgi:hypothetical protein